MGWEVNITDECKAWYADLREEEQDSITAGVELLQEDGPMLGMPHSSGIATSKYSHMRELRIQHKGDPYRVLYAFDPNRAAILLIGGDKTGNDRWYEIHVPKADKLYADHLERFGKGVK